MHEYDAALKDILTRPGSSGLAQLTGASSLKWINVEAPKVSNRRVDLLGELPDGSLVHIELQSRNEKYGKLPRQVALYVGEAPLRMRDRIEGPGVSVRFQLVDIRDLDGEGLLASGNMGDSVDYWSGSLQDRRVSGTRPWPSCLFSSDCGNWR